MRHLLFKLLGKDMNIWQSLFFASVYLVGAVIVLFGMQAYRDAARVSQADDNLLGSEYVVLTKPVSAVSTLAGVLGVETGSYFTESQIEDIENVRGVVSVAYFRTSNFPVYGALSLEGMEVSTEMFLESVPSCFLDVDDIGWRASVDKDVVPVIAPRAYLNFYNYGFAAARGMPQIDEDLFSLLPLNLIVRGDGKHKTYKGQLVGFTDRLNTILVPDDFLKEANKFYAPGEEENVSRVIVQTDGTDVDDLMTYIKEKNYKIDGGGDSTLKMMSIVKLVISGIIAMGMLVSFLSFVLLLVSILLQMQKNRYRNETLHQLGYPYARIAVPYQMMAVGVDILVWFLAFVVVMVTYPAVTDLMLKLSPGFQPSGMGTLVIVTLIMSLLFSLIHILIIRSRIRQ